MIPGLQEVAAAAEGYSAQAMRWLNEFLLDQWKAHRSELIYAGVALVWTLVRAMGKTVVSGQTGLKFSFGRATREVGPGFYPLIPFLQVIRTVPTRSRTLDLPSQRVTTDDGLVFDVDANLVYRVVDVRRALIEIDHLERGMLQVLALSVQELLRHRSRAKLYASAELDRELSQRMARQIAVWGVEVEHAGFPSLRPSPETLRVTQMASLGGERRSALGSLVRGDAGTRAGLALLGSPTRIQTRTHMLAERHRGQRHRRRMLWLVRDAASRIKAAQERARERQGYFARRAREERERKQARKAALASA